MALTALYYLLVYDFFLLAFCCKNRLLIEERFLHLAVMLAYSNNKIHSEQVFMFKNSWRTSVRDASNIYLLKKKDHGISCKRTIQYHDNKKMVPTNYTQNLSYSIYILQATKSGIEWMYQPALNNVNPEISVFETNLLNRYSRFPIIALKGSR